MEGLRGLAILLVFTCHYYDIIWKDLPGLSRPLQAFGSVLLLAGGTGVDLFFVLSGFLIYGAVRKPRFQMLGFIGRRAKRIYPTFLFVFAIYLAISPILSHLHAASSRYANRIPADFPGNALFLLANLFFLPGVFAIQPLMNVAWSLSYEVMFYLCLPLVIIFFPFRGQTQRWRLSAIGVTALVFLAANVSFPDLFYTPLNPSHPSHVRAVMFLGGMLVFELVEATENRSGHRIFDLIAILLTLIGIGVASTRWTATLNPPSEIVRQDALVSAFLLIAYTLLVFVTLTPGTWLSSLCNIAPLRWLGNISYSFYLIHGLPLHAFGIAAGKLGLSRYPAPIVWTIFSMGYFIVFLVTAACSAWLFVNVEKRWSLNSASQRKQLQESSPSFPLATKGSVRDGYCRFDEGLATKTD